MVVKRLFNRRTSVEISKWKKEKKKEKEKRKKGGKEARFGYSFYLFTQGSRPPLAQTQYRSRFIFYSSLIEFELNLAKVSPLPFFLSLSPSLFASSVPLWIVIFFSLFLPFPRLLPVDRYSNLPVCSLLSIPPIPLPIVPLSAYSPFSFHVFVPCLISLPSRRDIPRRSSTFSLDLQSTSSLSRSRDRFEGKVGIYLASYTSRNWI